MSEHPVATHPPDDVLAALAEPGALSWPAESLVEHLAACRRCMAVYAQFVDLQLRRCQNDELAAPIALVEHALRIPDTPQSAGSSKSIPVRGRPRHRTAAWAAGLAAAAALLVIVGLRVDRDRSPITPEFERAVVQRLREDSPGGIVYSDEWAPLARGVRGSMPADDAAEVRRLVDAYDPRAPSPDVAFWLVALFLATDQRLNAEAYLDECLVRFPFDPRFQNLAAILAYKENRLAVAEAHLRAGLALDRSASLLLNLAILQHEQGLDTESRALLQELEQRFPDSPLVTYARTLGPADR